MKRIALLLGAALALAISGPALAQSPIVIKFSHVVAPDTPKGKGSLKFKELAGGGYFKIVNASVEPALHAFARERPWLLTAALAVYFFAHLPALLGALTWAREHQVPTLGVCLGCVGGVSALFIAGALLPEAQAKFAYYAVFFALLLWALAAGSALYWALLDTGLCDSADLGHLDYADAGSFEGGFSCDPARAQPVLDTYRRVLSGAADLITDVAVRRAAAALSAAAAVEPTVPSATVSPHREAPSAAGGSAVIARNDMIRVSYEVGGVRLSVMGKAQRSARVGEPVAVLNTTSNRTIDAVATGPGTAVAAGAAQQFASR